MSTPGADRTGQLSIQIGAGIGSNFSANQQGGGYVWPPEAPQLSLFVIDSVTMMIHETTEILAKKLRKPFPAVKKLIAERKQLHSMR